MTTGELLDIERVTSSSERGGWKRAEDQYLAGRLLYFTPGSGQRMGVAPLGNWWQAPHPTGIR